MTYRMVPSRIYLIGIKCCRPEKRAGPKSRRPAARGDKATSTAAQAAGVTAEQQAAGTTATAEKSAQPVNSESKKNN